MPIQEDIMDHDLIGPAIRQGRTEGQIRLLLGLIEERFGIVPADVPRRMASMTPDELEATGRRIFKAAAIEDLFSR